MRPAWGVGRCDEAVNRRERLADGRVILGWDPDGMVDPQVPVLQLQRRDGSALATLVGFGCHTVAAGPEVLAYSADFAGPLRAAVRAWTGGECVFLQGAAGNVLPRVAFAPTLGPARAMGRRLALAALAAVADRPAWGRAFDRSHDGSVTPFHLYRPRPEAVRRRPAGGGAGRRRLPLGSRCRPSRTSRPSSPPSTRGSPRRARAAPARAS